MTDHLSLSGGSPPRGTPGGHIGERIAYAYCIRCGREWVWNASGMPSCMDSCGHPDEGIVIVNYKAESYGRLADNTVGADDEPSAVAPSRGRNV